MKTLSFPAFQAQASKGNAIAVYKSIPSDLETPVSSFLKLARKAPYAVLLESAEQGEQIGRYSIIGIHPAAIYLQKKSGVFKIKNGKTRRIAGASHILQTLEKEMKPIKITNAHEVPGFSGGFTGYFSYENVQYFESIALRKKKGTDIPTSVFFQMDTFLTFDHYRKTITVISIQHLKSKKKLRPIYQKALRQINALIKNLADPLKTPPKNKKINTHSLKPNLSKAAFESKVRKIKDLIKRGECIQVVLSQRFSMKAPENDFQIYRALRSINPSPYMFYFRFGNLRLIGASPELLVKKTGARAEVRPIAGTRPRGRTAKEDRKYQESLLASPKEMAEHIMLVDLGRNDLGRVCRFHSVKVGHFARVENYSHVMHLVSDVDGKLKPQKNAFSLLEATFPAGTVSGAPKIRAMQIIDSLEEEQRGPYAGALGYFGYNHDMEMCIMIRTLVIHRQRLHVQAGAGIVKDSNPKREYQETVSKAKALVQALESQEQFV